LGGPGRKEELNIGSRASCRLGVAFQDHFLQDGGKKTATSTVISVLDVRIVQQSPLLIHGQFGGRYTCFQGYQEFKQLHRMTG